MPLIGNGPQLCMTASDGFGGGVQAYQEIVDKYVMESIFSQFMYKTLPTCNHLFVFKKQFCMQMALSGVYTFPVLLRIPLTEMHNSPLLSVWVYSYM